MPISIELKNMGHKGKRISWSLHYWVLRNVDFKALCDFLLNGKDGRLRYMYADSKMAWLSNHWLDASCHPGAIAHHPDIVIQLSHLLLIWIFLPTSLVSNL